MQGANGAAAGASSGAAAESVAAAEPVEAADDPDAAAAAAAAKAVAFDRLLRSLGWEEVAANEEFHPQGNGASAPAASSGTRGWWLASDGRWYPPDLRPNGHEEVVAAAATAEAGAAAPDAGSAVDVAPATAAVEAPEERPVTTVPLAAAAPGAAPVVAPAVAPATAAAPAVAPEQPAPPPQHRRPRVLAAAAVVGVVLLAGGLIGGLLASTSSSGKHNALGSTTSTGVTSTSGPTTTTMSAAEKAAQRRAAVLAARRRQIAHDRASAGKIVLSSADVPAGWQKANRIRMSPDLFAPSAGLTALLASHPECRQVASAFGGSGLRSDAVVLHSYQTPRAASIPAYGAVENVVAFLPRSSAARAEVKRMAAVATPAQAACVGLALKARLAQLLGPGTSVTVHSSAKPLHGLSHGQSGVAFRLTGQVRQHSASYPLSFTLAGVAGPRAVVFLYSGSVANGGGGPQMTTSLVDVLSARIARFGGRAA